MPAKLVDVASRGMMWLPRQQVFLPLSPSPLFLFSPSYSRRPSFSSVPLFSPIAPSPLLPPPDLPSYPQGTTNFLYPQARSCRWQRKTHQQIHYQPLTRPTRPSIDDLRQHLTRQTPQIHPPVHVNVQCHHPQTHSAAATIANSCYRTPQGEERREKGEGRREKGEGWRGQRREEEEKRGEGRTAAGRRGEEGKGRRGEREKCLLMWQPRCAMWMPPQ